MLILLNSAWFAAKLINGSIPSVSIVAFSRSQHHNSSPTISAMAPGGRKTRRTKYRERAIRSKKAKESAKGFHCIPKATSPSIEDDDGDGENASSSGCSTPKGQRFRIPELLSCPPAPKKRRVALRCSSQISKVSFFNPPDLETFFLFASRDISVWNVWCLCL